MKNTLIILTACITFTLLFFYSYGLYRFYKNPLNRVKKWCIVLDYDHEKTAIKSRDLEKYGMVILDPDHRPNIYRIKHDLIFIAYVSVGEAETYRSYWSEIKHKPWIISENSHWQGNYYVDVRSPQWQEIIIDTVIPQIIKLGFKGIMMDTLDTAAYLEEDASGKYSGSYGAMIEFIKRIHKKYPDLLLISNNGFEILDKIAPYLSGFLVEDINMMVDFKNNSYKIVPRQQRQQNIRILKRLMVKYKLPVFNIDYVSMDNKDRISWCIKESEKLGFKPYIAEKNLDKIYETRNVKCEMRN